VLTQALLLHGKSSSANACGPSFGMNDRNQEDAHWNKEKNLWEISLND
jgi:hypothetical protein